MRRIPAVFVTAFLFVGLLAFGGWQTQQNFGTGGVIGPGVATSTDIPTFNGTSGGVLQDPASCTLTSTVMQCPLALVLRWSTDLGLSRDLAGVIDVGTGAAGNKLGSMNLATITASTAVNAATYLTASNCNVNGVSPAACGAAAAGVVVVPTTTATYTVNTTAVTANSRIQVWPITDNSGVSGAPTCTAPPTPFIAYPSGRTAATSFTFALPSTTGTSCWNYSIIN
jgi:hypothetical protein